MLSRKKIQSKVQSAGFSKLGSGPAGKTGSKPGNRPGSWLYRLMAFELEPVSMAEKLVASVGGLIGIGLICVISYQVSGAEGVALIVPSMGASAVLVFAVPHGRLSQPWPLFGGNIISAVIGVACYQLIVDPSMASGSTYDMAYDMTFALAAGVAVGLAIASMHLFNCMHPPGGATALVAVIGGPTIHDLGYSYVLSPIALNVIILFFLAIVINSFFAWRRYPATAMMRFTDKQEHKVNSQLIDRLAIEKSLASLDLVMDVSIDDLQRLFQLSLEHAKGTQLTAEQIKIHGFYTNGLHGPQWSVRRIIDESHSTDPKKDMVIYRVVEGAAFNSADSCRRDEFAQWAAREVFPNKLKSV